MDNWLELEIIELVNKAEDQGMSWDDIIAQVEMAFEYARLREREVSKRE